jgi:predicted ATPase/DNA-binding winged helix-turn-helix (wHTH) protein
MIEFGRFAVVPRRRELLADGRPIDVGDRAFDVLMALIEDPGVVVSKNALLKRVWPDRVVAENNLQAQISALRRAFGPDRDLIRTVAGRGYQFIGSLRTTPASQDLTKVAAPITPFLTNLPEQVSGLIARDVELNEILFLTEAHRLVTLTGVGGIGKTRLGLEIARHALPRFADGVWVVELARLSDPALVPSIVAASLGIETSGAMVSVDRIAHLLNSKQLMLLLDNCEHLIGAAAAMAEALLHANPGTRIVATSREPLRVEGEWVYSVPPLAVPTEENSGNESPLRYGAVQLFVERARAARSHFVLDSHIAVIATICRRLDGIPLAIELAAARTAALGIDDLADGLNDRFQLLTHGSRTALPRQQTLRATFDWSYALLSYSERLVLRCLAVFAGDFSLRAAIAIVIDLPAPEVVDNIANLVAKSLVGTDVQGASTRYRLLETTRAYAFELLVEAGELSKAARRHAEYYCQTFEQAETELRTRSARDWLSAYGRRIHEVRAALTWAFSLDGDASIGVVLTAAATPLWLHLSQLDECRDCVLRALAVTDSGTVIGETVKMQLYIALGHSMAQTRRPLCETRSTWVKVLDYAEKLNDTENQLGALWGLFSYHVTIGEGRVALALAQRFYRVASQQSDSSDMLVGNQLIGWALHVLGNQTEARRHIEQMGECYAAPVRQSQIFRYQFDQQVLAQALLSRVLWLQGLPETALRTAKVGAEAALATGHALTICIVLTDAVCPIALHNGALSDVERFVAILLDYSAKHGLDIWNAWGRSIRGAMLSQHGDATEGLCLLRRAMSDIRQSGFVSRNRAHFGMLAQGFAHVGQPTRGLAVIDDAFAQLGPDKEHWYAAELFRIKGELCLLAGAEGAESVAEVHFRQALDLARRQGALLWELRASTSIARLWQAQSRTTDARETLVPICDRFVEGFDIPDIKAARALMSELS